ncbi:MAG: hypothetical protein PHV08_08040, partial [Sulfurovaceae bacterium]|nr:hypothetical protein [Sulfurovaceae bacterium]
FNRGASGERQKNWSEIIKVLQVSNPSYVAPMLPVMLRDVDSPEAEAAQKIIDDMIAKEENAKENAQEDPAMTKMMLEFDKLRAEIDDLKSEAKLKNAKAEVLLPAQASSTQTENDGGEMPA